MTEPMMTSALTSGAASLGQLVGVELVASEDAVSQAERLAAGVEDGAALGQLVAGASALAVRKRATVRRERLGRVCISATVGTV